jgi:hypothetical protein
MTDVEPRRPRYAAFLFANEKDAVAGGPYCDPEKPQLFIDEVAVAADGTERFHVEWTAELGRRPTTSNEVPHHAFVYLEGGSVFEVVSKRFDVASGRVVLVLRHVARAARPELA